MDQLISRLVLFSDLGEDSILARVAAVCGAWKAGADPLELRRRLSLETKRVLDLATAYGFDGSLWQNYLTWLLISHENSFSLTCELEGAKDGTINDIAKADLDIFLALFRYDFAPMEDALGVRLFGLLTHYRAIPKRGQMYSRDVSARVRSLSEALASAPDREAAFALVAEDYRRYGAGLFGLGRAFRIRERDGAIAYLPIRNLDSVTLDDLVGYELQKARLRAAVEAFVERRPFNNILLYGDAGTGKSTSVKALLNEYGDRGLRVIEIYKHQFHLLQDVIADVKTRHCRFILLIDDLSFDEGEVEYKYLKAIIEGGLETRPDNVLILATSNRRHLIRETWRDRDDMEHDGDIHRSDTVEEKLSLAGRFGCSILFAAPDRNLWKEIVLTLAAEYPDLGMSEQELMAAANRFEIRHGGVSGRTARQFINEIAGEAGV